MNYERIPKICVCSIDLLEELSSHEIIFFLGGEFRKWASNDGLRLRFRLPPGECRGICKSRRGGGEIAKRFGGYFHLLGFLVVTRARILGCHFLIFLIFSINSRPFKDRFLIASQ
jgi:hypothetical protein